MCLADRPGGLPWIQLVAFGPLLAAIVQANSRLQAVALGAIWAAVRFVPLGAAVGVLALPLPAVTALTIYLLGVFALFAAIVFAVRKAPIWVVALTAGASLVAIEVTDAALPFWGTSLSLARDWVHIPWAIRGLVAFAGPHSVGFFIVTFQALLWVGILHRRPWFGLSAASTLFAVALLSGWPRTLQTSETLRVATIAGESRFFSDDAIVGLLADASRRGARIVVLSEAMTEIHAGERSAFMATWTSRARTAGIIRSSSHSSTVSTQATASRYSIRSARESVNTPSATLFPSRRLIRPETVHCSHLRSMDTALAPSFVRTTTTRTLRGNTRASGPSSSYLQPSRGHSRRALTTWQMPRSERALESLMLPLRGATP